MSDASCEVSNHPECPATPPRKAAAGRRRKLTGLLALLCVVSLALLAGECDTFDSDGDQIVDLVDNCYLVPNSPGTWPDDRNQDFDRYGNVCDGDLNQDGKVDNDDLFLLNGERTDIDTEIACPDPDDPSRCMCALYGRCRMAADVNADGAININDRNHFLISLDRPPAEPGPAGAWSHGYVGDNAFSLPPFYSRNFCRKSDFDQCMDDCIAGGADEETCVTGECEPLVPPNSFRHRAPYDPDGNPPEMPNLIPNPRLQVSGGETWPHDWENTSSGKVVFQNDVNRSAEQEDGSFRWYAWRDWGPVLPAAWITIDPSRSYVFSYYMCIPEGPPVTTANYILEQDGGGNTIWVTPQNGSAAMSAEPGIWQEAAFIYVGRYGTMIKGKTSQAVAEILLCEQYSTAHPCPPGIHSDTYFVRMKSGEFEANDTLQYCNEGWEDCDDGPWVPLSGISVAAKPDIGIAVDYRIGLEHRVWWDEFKPLTEAITEDDLWPVIRESHWTAWTAKCHGVEVVNEDPRELGTEVAQFGDDGYVCGTRTYSDEAYLFVANTWYDFDPYAEFQHQFTGKRMNMQVTIEGLDYTPALHPEFFNFTTDSWEENASVDVVPVTGGFLLDFDVDPLDIAAIKLVRPAP